MDRDLRVVSASRSFYEVFKVKPEKTVGQLIYDLGNKQWDIPKLRELLETILPQKATFDDYEVEHDFATIGRRIMLLNARQIERGMGKERIILLAIEDITERKEIESGLEKTRKELEIIKKTADEASEFAESIINTVREPLIGRESYFEEGRLLYKLMATRVEITDQPPFRNRVLETFSRVFCDVRTFNDARALDAEAITALGFKMVPPDNPALLRKRTGYFVN